MNDDNRRWHGPWVAAFVDLLGQKEAFLKTDFMPTKDDPTSEQALFAALKDSLGVVRSLRKLLEQFRAPQADETVDSDSPLRDLTAPQLAEAQRMKRRRVRELRWSDGIVLYAPLWQSDEHSPVMGLYEILGSLTVLMLMQLAVGKPVRGGVDAGMGIEEDGQLFGAALVKAYLLESKTAQHPRIVVGPSLEAIS